MKEKNDIYLLKQIKKSDYNAFNQLYEKYWEDVFLFAYKLTKDKENAFLIVQDLFIMLWEKREQLTIISLKSYLFQSVKYSFFQQYKNKRSTLENLTDELENYLLDNIDEPNLEIIEILKNALEELPVKRKEILLMNKYQNMSPQEIAEELNISTQTVRNQLSSSLSQLRCYFLDYYKKHTLSLFIFFIPDIVNMLVFI